jgi:hypothetical protein
MTCEVMAAGYDEAGIARNVGAVEPLGPSGAGHGR